MKTIRDSGFLSDEAAQQRRPFEEKHSDVCSGYLELNRIAQGFLNSTGVSNRDLQGLLCALFYGRMLSLYQTVYLCTVGGMAAERDILLRAMIETHIRLHFCAKSRDNAVLLVQSSEHSRVQLLENARMHPGSKDAASLAELNRLISAIKHEIRKKKIRKPSTRSMAKEIGCLADYDLQYSLFCKSVHADARDFQSLLHQSPDGSISAIFWGPDHRDSVLRLVTAMDYMLKATITPHFRCAWSDSREVELWVGRIKNWFEALQKG